MIGKQFNSRFYDFLGVIIEVTTNSDVWAESAGSYLFMSRQSRPTQPGIKLVLSEIPSIAALNAIPLPGEKYLVEEGTLLLNWPVPYKIFAAGHKRWSDYEGYGRVCIDYASGESMACRVRDSGIHPLYDNIVLVSNVLTSLLLKAGFYSVHASCVSIDGTGVLFTGNSGRGKSTAAYAMLCKGCPIISDDRALIYKVRDSYQGAAITDVFKLRQQAVEDFFPELARERPLYVLDGEYYYKVGQAESRLRFQMSTPVSMVMILEQTGKPESNIRKINPARVVGELFPVTLSTADPYNTGRKFNYLMDFLDAVECYQVSFGTSMENFADAVMALARG